jgi:hypothetical protein
VNRRASQEANAAAAPSDGPAIVNHFVEGLLHMDLREISPELVLVDPELGSLARLNLPEPGSFWASRPPSPEPAPLIEGCASGRRKLSSGRTRAVAVVCLTLVAVLMGHVDSSAQRPSLSVDSRLSSAGSQAMHAAAPAEASQLPIRFRWPTSTQGALRSRDGAASALRLGTRRTTPGTRGASASKSPAGQRARKGQRRPSGRAAADEQKHQGQVHTSANHPRRQRTAAPQQHEAGHVRAGRQVLARRAVQSITWKPVAGATYYNVVLWRDGKRVLDLWPSSPKALLTPKGSDRSANNRLRPGRYLWFVYPGFGPKTKRQYGTLVGSGLVSVAKR